VMRMEEVGGWVAARCQVWCSVVVVVVVLGGSGHGGLLGK